MRAPVHVGIVSTHSRAKAAARKQEGRRTKACKVSTHSRAKAAASQMPVECGIVRAMFQHTAARKRLLKNASQARPTGGVSTHSRAKAAAPLVDRLEELREVSTHSRAKAAAIRHVCVRPYKHCFNTQPRESGC